MSEQISKKADENESQKSLQYLCIGMHEEPIDSIFSKSIKKELRKALAKEKAKKRVIKWSDETYKRFFNNQNFLRGKK